MKTYFTVNSLSIENFKGIEKFNANLDNLSVLLLGSEGTGKTNIWLALQMVIGNIPTAVIKQGEEKGETIISISKDDTNYRFEFRLSSDIKPKLTTYVNGKKITQAKQAYIIEQLRPQQINIDKLINATGQEQVGILKKGLGIDTSKIEEEIDEALIDRRVLKNEVDNFHFEFVKETQKPVVSIEDLQQEKYKLKEDNEKEWELYKKSLSEYHDIEKINSKVDLAEDRLKTLRAEEKELLNKLDKVRQGISDGDKWIEEHPRTEVKKPSYDPKSLDDIDNKIADVMRQDQEYSKWLSYLENKKKLEDKQKRLENKNRDILMLRESLLEKMNDSDYGVEGLNIVSEISNAGHMKSSLSYKGLPFDDDSINTAKKYAIGARLQMNMFKEGELAILHVNGSMMSSDTVKEIIQECNDVGIQALVEITSKDIDKELVVETYSV